ncbi:E3 ubiquitin-protein ligase NEURL3 isoform X2 [Pelodiscus sinensis]|uniref:E3 ubiquitin-protein ligase NEURL3 isoform X2 n=1 Tax=Pelodiscus sinensis TaxID=13735 RepID=UPI003F6ACA82
MGRAGPAGAAQESSLRLACVWEEPPAMGTCFGLPCDVDSRDEDSSQTLFFHPSTYGSKIRLYESCQVAERIDSFHDGIIFTSRPIHLHERVTLKILKKEGPWHGGLRVGFTSMDPLEIDASLLPPFACPNLVLQGRTWAAVLPDVCGEEDTVLTFWVDHRGRVFFGRQQGVQDILLLKGVPVRAPLWAIVDVYGHTKAVQLLAPACREFHGRPQGCTEPCVICFSHETSALLHPCGHASFCYCCAQKVFRRSGLCPLCRGQIQNISQARLGT